MGIVDRDMGLGMEIGIASLNLELDFGLGIRIGILIGNLDWRLDFRDLGLGIRIWIGD